MGTRFINCLRIVRVKKKDIISHNHPDIQIIHHYGNMRRCVSRPYFGGKRQKGKQQEKLKIYTMLKNKSAEQ